MWRQVRVIVERLARRCGYDAVAGAMPPDDKRLLTHIHRENLRKQRLRSSEAGSQVGPCAPHSAAVAAQMELKRMTHRRDICVFVSAATFMRHLLHEGLRQRS